MVFNKFNRSVNLSLLIGGFGVGQGSLFIAQTWLIGQGELVLLGLLGFHLSLMVLASQIVDWGGLVILARTSLLNDTRVTGWNEALKNYWALCFVRLLIAALIVFIAVMYACYIQHGFSYFYVLISVLGLIVWSFNASGLLDGLRLSGVTGITVPIPYFVSAIALFYSPILTQSESGILLGSAYLLGVIISVVGQWIILNNLGKPVYFIRPNREIIQKVAKEGAIYLAGFLPGQVLVRFQILFSTLILGIEASGIFIYGKQVINMANQVIAFVRRVEFPKLVNTLKYKNNRTIYASASVQKIGLILGIAGGIFFSLGPLMAAPFMPMIYIDALHTVSLLSPVIMSGILFSVLNQGLIGMGEFYKSAVATNTVTIIAIIMSWPLPHLFGILGFTIAESGGHVIGILLSILIYKRI